MCRAAAFYCMFCLLLCLSLGCEHCHCSSRLLHRDRRMWTFGYPTNHIKRSEPEKHHVNVVERTKKMTANLGDALRKIKNSTQDFGRNLYDRINLAGNGPGLNDDDVRQYEQLVIMKKYPYLDIKEFELKYRAPSIKNSRQSIKYVQNAELDDDPIVKEQNEDGPNVEIVNLGLTGFAIPSPVKRVSMAASKTKEEVGVKDKQAEYEEIGITKG